MRDSRVVARLKALSVVLAFVGVLAAIVLVVWSGFGRVSASLSSVGYWGFALLCAFQVFVAAVLGIAWRVIAPVATGRRGLALDGLFIWARLVRDACLPFSQLGGMVIGARAHSLHGQTCLSPVFPRSAILPLSFPPCSPSARPAL